MKNSKIVRQCGAALVLFLLWGVIIDCFLPAAVRGVVAETMAFAALLYLHVVLVAILAGRAVHRSSVRRSETGSADRPARAA